MDNIAKYPKYWHKKGKQELAPLPSRSSRKKSIESREGTKESFESEGDKAASSNDDKEVEEDNHSTKNGNDEEDAETTKSQDIKKEKTAETE